LIYNPLYEPNRAPYRATSSHGTDRETVNTHNLTTPTDFSGHQSGITEIVFDRSEQLLTLSIDGYDPKHLPQLSGVSEKIKPKWKGTITFQALRDEPYTKTIIEATICGDHGVDITFSGAEEFALGIVETLHTMNPTPHQTPIAHPIVIWEPPERAIMRSLREKRDELHLALFSNEVTTHEAMQALRAKLYLYKKFQTLNSDGIICFMREAVQRLEGTANYYVSFSGQYGEHPIDLHTFNSWELTRRVLDYGDTRNSLWYSVEINVTTNDLKLCIELDKNGRYTIWTEYHQGLSTIDYKKPIILPAWAVTYKQRHAAIKHAFCQTIDYMSKEAQKTLLVRIFGT
jgi:hypothetical protein